MGFCDGFSRFYLLLINALVGLGGSVIIGLTVYGIVNFTDFDDLVPLNIVKAVMSIGIFTLLLSILGCVGVSRQSKWLMGIYLTFLVLLLVAQVGLAVGVMLTMGVFDGIGNDSIDTASSALYTKLVDTEYSVYNHCCGEMYTPVPECLSNQGKAPCIEGSELQIEGDGVCDALENIYLAESVYPIVGMNGTSCGGGNPIEFTKNLSEWLIENSNHIVVATICIASIQLLAAILTCVLLCVNNGQYGYDPDNVWANKPRQANEPNQLQAGAIAVGGAPVTRDQRAV